MSKTFGIAAAFVLAIFFIAGSGFLTHQFIPGAEKAGREKKSIDLVADDAKANYKNYCSGCHGEQMEAFADRQWKHGSSKENLFDAIKVGYPDEGMPGFDTAFTDNEINALADYIINGIKNIKKYDFSKAETKSNFFTSASQNIKLDTVATGMNIGWSMAFLPGGEMLITERSGKLYRLTKSRKKIEVNGVPEVLAEGQGGLMDVTLHPNFTNNRLIYLSYSLSKKEDGKVLSTTAVMRAKLEGDKLTQQKNIFIALPYATTKHHYGSRLQFGKDGMLYISVGERGNEKENPQTLTNSLGKIHRIKDDGTIPDDNPFVHVKGATPSIYSYGHRNPQGLTINPVTGDIWENEHGPRGGDEINIVRKGKNYGWPVITYGINYNGIPISNITKKEGMEQPLLYWVPSIAPSGMAFINSNRYKGWNGDLLVGSLRFKYLNLCKLKGNKVVHQEMLLKNIGRLRDVRVGPDGYIYVAVESPVAAIFRLIPVNHK